jgi:hypothetical protein
MCHKNWHNYSLSIYVDINLYIRAIGNPHSKNSLSKKVPQNMEQRAAASKYEEDD